MIPWQAKLIGATLKNEADKRRPRPASGFGPYEKHTCLSWQLVDGVLEVELHRAPCNEIGTSMLADLEKLVSYLKGSDEVAAVLFHSSIERGFCAGADLRELHAELKNTRVEKENAARIVSSRVGELARARNFLDRIHACFNAIDTLPQPTVAMLHGFVFGGGFELALTCDVLIAEESARFAFPELRLGLIPGFGGVPRLERDVGNAVIRDLLFSGRSLNAKRAHELGLVSQVVPRHKGLRAARNVAKQMLNFDDHTVRAAKRFVKTVPFQALEREKVEFLRLLGSDTVERALEKFVNSDDPRPYLP